MKAPVAWLVIGAFLAFCGLFLIAPAAMLALQAISDDAGNWHRLEAYLEEWTEATLTHTMCPCCLNKWYATPRV